MAEGPQHAIAIDAGESQVRGALVSIDGIQANIETEVNNWTRLGAEPDVEVTCLGIRRLAEEVLARSESRCGWGDIVGIGVTVPNPVDRDGFVDGTTWANWKHVPFRGFLQQTFRDVVRPGNVAVLNDANAAGLGEATYGRGRRQPDIDLVHFVITRGVAAGIVLGGELRIGANGCAGEWGHAVIDPQGALCWSCQRQRGCLETIASGQAMALKAADLIRQGRATKVYELAYARSEEERRGQTKFGDGGGHTTIETKVGGERRHLTIWGRDVAEAARSGDADALHIVQEAGTALGQAVVQALHILNPDMVTVGGFIADLCPAPFIEAARDCVFRHALPSVLRAMPELTNLRDHGPLYGAVAQVMWSASRGR
jgi:predicted NBD/HSP70 family sugar kinase